MPHWWTLVPKSHEIIKWYIHYQQNEFDCRITCVLIAQTARLLYISCKHVSVCSSSGQLWLNSALIRDFAPFRFSIFLSVTLHSWNKVHFPSSSSQQSTITTIYRTWTHNNGGHLHGSLLQLYGYTGVNVFLAFWGLKVEKLSLRSPPVSLILTQNRIWCDFGCLIFQKVWLCTRAAAIPNWQVSFVCLFFLTETLCGRNYKVCLWL